MATGKGTPALTCRPGRDVSEPDARGDDHADYGDLPQLRRDLRVT